MSASSTAGGSSFPSTRDPAQQPDIPHVALRPRHPSTCRCSQCYLRSSLFPRGERDQILLPPPSWLESPGTGNSGLDSTQALPRTRNDDPSGKGKGKEIVSPIPSWTHDVRRLEGRVEGKARSPSWHQTKAAVERSHPMARNNPRRASTSLHGDSNARGGRTPPESRLRGSSTAGSSSRPPRPSGNDPMTAGPSVTPRTSQPLAERREPVLLTPVMSSLQTDSSPRTGGKRKLSDRDDTLDPTEHVLDFRNPPPPQGREPLRGFPRQRINSRGDSAGLSSGYSRQGTPESHFQSYRSHVPGNASPRNQFTTETASMETGPSSSRPRSVSEVGLWSTGAGPSRGRGSPSSEGHQPRRSPPGEASSSNVGIQSSVTRFNARARNPVPSASAPRTPRESDDEGHASGSQGGSSQTTIRFREPLTADSRQDRRVVKGGVATIQVKWDSDRKRRQGYFAPDAGPEKSKFRHYSKDDCCFDG